MVVILVSSAFGQYDPQYVSAVRGDTLVVKDFAAFGASNTLTLLMTSDSLAPATRVYELVDYGFYPCIGNPTTSASHKTIIRGTTESSLKLSAGLDPAPPIITGNNETGAVSNGGMNVGYDLLIKNVDLEIGNLSGNGGGWAFFNFNGAGKRLEVDNCILEHTWWCWVGSSPADSRVFFNNDYMVNMDGHTCRRNGGITDFNAGGVTHQDTLMVQNCTHVNFQGTAYKFRYGVNVDKVLFNHNDFIDCSGFVFMNNGDQSNMSVTNNIFVNVQLQGYSNTLQGPDGGEVDMDSLPMGLVNLRVDSTFLANGAKFYADRNLAYWDPSLSDIVSTLNGSVVNGATDWVSQMITMNTRTAAIFADDATYPLCYNGTWYNQLPTFANTDVLFSTQLAALKAYSIACVDVTYGSPLASWRQATNPEATNFPYADWPMPINLSYSDGALLTAGLGGFPLGDLNWIPAQYTAWKAQEAGELAQIQYVLDHGTLSVDPIGQRPAEFKLQQNYPNPFNPTTKISYTIGNAGHVTLKVYNIMGQYIATLVDGYKNADSYEVNFNASNLSSGIYLYELRAGNNVITKKMVLMK